MLLVPRRAALESLVLLALAAPLPVAAWLTGGTGVAILAFLGAITGIGTKAFLAAGRALILCAGTAVLVAAATAAYGRVGWVGLIVAAAALLGGVANHQSPGVLSIAPAMAAIGGMARLHATWLAAGGWVLAGAAYTLLVVALFRVKVKPKPVDAATVWIHTAVLTVLCGGGRGGGRLAPAARVLAHPHLCVRAAAQLERVGLPLPEPPDRHAGRGVALTGDRRRFAARRADRDGAGQLVRVHVLHARRKYAPTVVFLTTTTILLTSGGLAAAAVRLNEYRIAWTFAGVVITAASGAAVVYADRRLAAKAHRGAVAPGPGPRLALVPRAGVANQVVQMARPRPCWATPPHPVAQANAGH
ncbi:MAG TPA: hypothetical protein VLW50_02080 [Streptosporangiaceae bacterium]|nr:hypothetical protein [Streptosporangiaceae bacterium]